MDPMLQNMISTPELLLSKLPRKLIRDEAISGLKITIFCPSFVSAATILLCPATADIKDPTFGNKVIERTQPIINRVKPFPCGFP
jgi:hypothetical protein